MKLIPDPKSELWLTSLTPDDDNFDWDNGNRGKNEKKHGVSDEDIQSLLSVKGWVFYGRIIEPVHQTTGGCSR